MSGAPRRRPVPDDLFGGRLKGAYLLELDVARVEDTTAWLRTITFHSPDLLDFAWKPGQDLMFTVPGAEPVARRRYTIRRADPVAGTIDVAIVMHGSGPFARWATQAAPGEQIEAIGPRGVIELRPDAPHLLFVGDESAIGATFAMLEALPPGSRASAWLAAEDAGPFPEPAPVGAQVDLRWCSPAGLIDELVDGLGDIDMPPGTVAYVNGERSLVRRGVEALTARGLAGDHVFSKAYWRRDRANAVHGEPPKD